MNAIANLVIVLCCFGVSMDLGSHGNYPLSLGYFGLAIAYVGFAWSFAP